MKKAIIISTLIATTVINSGLAYADASKEENIGVASGAIAGAAIAGPVGFILGSAIGGLIGSEVEKGGQLEQVQTQLNASTAREAQLKQDLAILQQESQLTADQSSQDFDTQWMTQGLTLNLMFTTGSSDLSDNDLNNIKQLSSVLNQFPELKIKLDGYADPRGSNSYNLNLSQQRVESVKKAFEALNIDSSRITSHAHGEAQGVKLEDNVDAYALARKVSVNFVEQSFSQLAQN